MDDALARAAKIKDFFFILNEVEECAAQKQPNALAFLNRWYDTLEAADTVDLAEIYSVGAHLARMSEFRVSDISVKLLTEQFGPMTQSISFSEILFTAQKNFPDVFPTLVSHLVDRINDATDDELVSDINVAMFISKTIFYVPELMEAALARVMAMDDEHLNKLECTRIVDALTTMQMGPFRRINPLYERGVEIATKIFEAYERLPAEVILDSQYFQWNLQCPFMVAVNQDPQTRLISDERISNVAMKLEVYVSEVGEDAIKRNDKYAKSRHGGKLGALKNYRQVLGDTRPIEPPVNRPFKANELKNIVAFGDRALAESEKEAPEFLCTSVDFQNMIEAGLVDTVTRIVENYLLMPDNVFAEYRMCRVFVELKDVFLGEPAMKKRFEQDDIPVDSTLGQFAEKLKRAFLARETIYDGEGAGEIISSLFDIEEIIPRLYKEIFREPISIYIARNEAISRELPGLPFGPEN